MEVIKNGHIIWDSYKEKSRTLWPYIDLSDMGKFIMIVQISAKYTIPSSVQTHLCGLLVDRGPVTKKMR